MWYATKILLTLPSKSINNLIISLHFHCYHSSWKEYHLLSGFFLPAHLPASVLGPLYHMYAHSRQSDSEYIWSLLLTILPWLPNSKSWTHCRGLQDPREYTATCLTSLTSNSIAFPWLFPLCPYWPYSYSWNIYLCSASGHFFLLVFLSGMLSTDIHIAWLSRNLKFFTQKLI